VQFAFRPVEQMACLGDPRVVDVECPVLGPSHDVMVVLGYIERWVSFGTLVSVVTAH